MVASMTAFSRQSSPSEWGVLVWELRTVNHRFLDASIRLPESLRTLEPAVRELLSTKLHRGKIEATLRLVSGSQAPFRFNFNEGVIKQLADAANNVRTYFPDAQTDLLAVLNWPGVLETETMNHDTVNQAALELLQHAIVDLLQMRRREGAQIKTFIQQRLEAILAIIVDVSQQIPSLLTAERERIALRIAELNHTDFNAQRLEQEMAILIQKTDVAEEIQRLGSHCQAMTDALSQSGPIGRRLDFLSQELHREANTLGSKALAVSLTHASIEMKVLIEQIREQVQNIE